MIKSNSITQKGKTIFLFFLFTFVMLSPRLQSQVILIETESFDHKGGWVVDPQFVEQMGSPYLMAHGLGQPVKNARTTIKAGKKGDYHVYARTMNWAIGNWDPPGRFKIILNGVPLPITLGLSSKWSWEYAGSIEIDTDSIIIELKDFTGFNGRCDAIYFSRSHHPPPSDKESLDKWRIQLTRERNDPLKIKEFDLVIVGGGIAGCASAIAAAEMNLNVALIHDRPVLGGNASSEIRVHTLGIYGHFERILKMLDTEHYPNGSPKALEDELKRHKNIESYENIDIYLSWRAFDAVSEKNTIRFVDARHNISGERIRFKAPYFVDCTGDGWIGYWAGAEYMYGRESKNKFSEEWKKHGELWSPEISDNRVMGSSILWRTRNSKKESIFPEVPWAVEISGEYESVKGTWNWEYTNDSLHQIDDAEKIRDHLLRAVYGSFYNAKQNAGKEKLKLDWVAYILGKRESRRLVGDYIYSFNDVRNNVKFPDSAVIEEREIDVHYQQNLVDKNKPDFLSEALYYNSGRYYVPYRTLYSKNIKNLFMAGRCFSCSHIGLGGPRVMRTTGQMGAAVGFAAYICKKYNVFPRDVYHEHLDEYMELIISQNIKP